MLFIVKLKVGLYQILNPEENLATRLDFEIRHLFNGENIHWASNGPYAKRRIDVFREYDADVWEIPNITKTELFNTYPELFL